MARRKRITVHNLTEIKYSDDLTIEFERLPDLANIRIVTYKWEDRMDVLYMRRVKHVIDIVEYPVRWAMNYMDDTFNLLVKFEMETDA